MARVELVGCVYEAWILRVRRMRVGERELLRLVKVVSEAWTHLVKRVGRASWSLTQIATGCGLGQGREGGGGVVAWPRRVLRHWRTRKKRSSISRRKWMEGDARR